MLKKLEENCVLLRWNLFLKLILPQTAAKRKRNVIAFHVKIFYTTSKDIYCYRKIYEDFRNELPDIPCLKETLCKVLHDNKLLDRIRRRYKPPRIKRDQTFASFKNSLNSNFKSTENDLRWTGDIT